MSSKPVFSFIPAQCFTLVRQVTYRRQLEKGGIFTKVSDTQVHQLMFDNILACLRLQLDKKSDSHIYALNAHFNINHFHFITEPDIAITNPHEPLSVQQLNSWPNPVIIIEVLSPNEKRERKFNWYCPIASLREYVRIHADRPLLELFVQQPGRKWKKSQIENEEDSVYLVSIGGYLSLAAVYDQVEIQRLVSTTDQGIERMESWLSCEAVEYNRLI